MARIVSFSEGMPPVLEVEEVAAEVVPNMEVDMAPTGPAYLRPGYRYDPEGRRALVAAGPMIAGPLLLASRW